MGTYFNYADVSHQVIYDQVNGGSGSEPLQLSAQEWTKLGNEVGETGQSYLQKVLGTILTARQGAAAAAATTAISAMVPWMDDVTQIAQATARRTQEQADYWVTAKNSVPPVPPSPKSVGFFSDPGEWAAEKMDWFPGITSDEEKAQQGQQAAAEQARQAMRVYQASSNGNIDAAPAFTAPQALDGSVGSLPLTSPSVGAAAAAPALGGGGMPAHLLAAYQPAAHQPAARPPAAHRPAADPPAATVSQLVPGEHTGPAGTVASPGRWATNPAVNPDATAEALVAGAGLGGGVTAARAARSAGGRRSSAPGATAFGPRPSTEFGPRPTASTPPIDEMNAARGGAGTARGTAASAGYGPPVGAGQQGEHRSKYLLQDDSNAIVGDLPPTAPPVIGADY